MADKRQIEAYRKSYESKTDEDLILEMQAWVPHSEMHIAAKQELHRREQAVAARKSEADKDHRQAQLAQTERHHAERQWWTRFSAWIGFAGFALAFATFLVGRFWPTTQVASLERRVAALERTPPAISKLSPTPTAQSQLQTPQQTATTPQASATPNPAAQTTPAPKTTP